MRLQTITASVAVALGAAVGAVSAPRPAVVEAELTTGRTAAGAPLEAAPVAIARLEGRIEPPSGGASAAVTAHPGPAGLTLRVRLAAATASAAHDAVEAGVQSVLTDYRAWHGEEVARIERATAELLRLEARIAHLKIPTSSLAGGPFEARRWQARNAGARAALARLRAAAPSAGVTKTASSTAWRARAALGAAAALLLWAIGWAARRWGVAGLVIVIGALLGGAAGLAQARRAPPEAVGRAVVRSGRDAELVVPRKPLAPRDTHNWMAAELRAGRLPLRVRFEARGVFEPDQGLVRLRAWGRDRAAVREVLDVGVARVHRLDAGKLEPPRAAHAGTLESLRKQLAYTLKVALGPDDMERALRLAAEITKEEHLAGPLASTPTDVLVPPRIAGPDVERRLLPFVLGGQLSGALLGLLSLVVVGQRRDG